MAAHTRTGIVTGGSGGIGRVPAARLRCPDPQHARDRGDRRPLRRVLRASLGDHAHRTLTKLVGVLARTSHNSDPPKIGGPRTRRDGSICTSVARSEAQGDADGGVLLWCAEVIAVFGC